MVPFAPIMLFLTMSFNIESYVNYEDLKGEKLIIDCCNRGILWNLSSLEKDGLTNYTQTIVQLLSFSYHKH